MKACGAALLGLTREELEAIADGGCDAPHCEEEMARFILVAMDRAEERERRRREEEAHTEGGVAARRT